LSVVYCWSALIALGVSPFAAYAVARSRKPFGSLGRFCTSFSAFETDEPLCPKMLRPLNSWSRPLFAAGADTEEGEGDGEEHGEDQVCRLRLAAEPREEELLVGVAAARVALPPARLGLRRRLRAALALLVLQVLRLLGLDCSACHRWPRIACTV